MAHYNVDSRSLKEYIDDDSIRLPRFQRGDTWDNRHRFELALSIFKGYPLGCVILCPQAVNDDMAVNWLIDGRQRRTTITAISTEPNLLYDWALSLFKGSKSDALKSQDDFTRAFNAYVRDFIDEDDPADSDDVTDDDESDEAEGNQNSSGEAIVDSTDSSAVADKTGHLGLLLDFLLFCYTYGSFDSKKSESLRNGFLSSFDFTDSLSSSGNEKVAKDRARYKEGGYVVKLIKDYFAECKADYPDEGSDAWKNVDHFIDFVQTRYGFSTADRQTIKNNALSKWSERQVKAMLMYRQIDDLLKSAKISCITPDQVEPQDQQKIFSLINSNGVPLSAVEVMSAKPAWNKEVHLNNPTIELAIQKLYTDKKINDKSILSTCVRWDMPACLSNEAILPHLKYFFPIAYYQKAKKGKDITLGFKLLAGAITGGIKKTDIDKLSNDEKNLNEATYQDFIRSFNEMLIKIEGISYFNVLRSWNISLSSFIGDAPTLDFLLICYRLFKAYGEPKSGTPLGNVFDKNAFIVIDRLIYEYAHSQWRGSGDSRVGRDLLEQQPKLIASSHPLLDAIPESQWKILIEDIMNKGMIGPSFISFQSMRPLILHYFGIKGKVCQITNDFSCDVDHIIPKAKFKSTPIADYWRDNIFNLALFPKTKNIQKNDIAPYSISDPAIKQAIVEYEEIKEEDFKRYVEGADYVNIRADRKPLILAGFTTDRTALLNKII